MFEGIGIQTMAGVAATIGVGVATPADCYVGLGAGNGSNTFDIEQPSGTLGCQYDFGNIRVFAEHISSPATGDDYPGINHIGVKGLVPIGGSIGYAGVSLAAPSEQLNGDPVLAQIGAETQGSVRMYGEYLMSVDKPQDGMVHAGIKFVF